MFPVQYNKDDVIIKQGDDGDNFYVIESGEVDILGKPALPPILFRPSLFDLKHTAKFPSMEKICITAYIINA